MGVKIKERRVKRNTGERTVYDVRVYFRGKYKHAGRFDLKTEAVKLKRALDRELAMGRVPQVHAKRNMPTLKEHADKWLEIIKVSKKPSTYDNYRYTLGKHLLPVLGEKRLDEIEYHDVEMLCLNIQKNGLSPRTAKLVADILSSIFRHAKRSGIVKDIPVYDKSHFIKGRGNRKSEEFYTKEEGAHIFATAKEHFPQLYQIVYTASLSGMRTGEITALTWGQVNFFNNTILVDRNNVKGEARPPKNNRIDQKIRLFPSLRKYLKEIKRYQEQEKGGSVHPADLVFPGCDGKMMNVRSLGYWFAKCCKLAGVRNISREYRNPFRHYHATWLISLGTAPERVQRQLRHASIKITYDIYGHLFYDREEEAWEHIDRQLTHEHKV